MQLSQTPRTVLINATDLAFMLRRLLIDYAHWTRELMLLSTTAGNDTDAVQDRLRSNTSAIAEITRQLYGNSAAAEIESVLNTQNALLIAYIDAVKANDTQRINEASARMHELADSAGQSLSQLIRSFDLGVLQATFNNAADMLENEAIQIFSGNYRQSIVQYDMIVDSFMRLADDLTLASLRQLQGLVNI